MRRAPEENDVGVEGDSGVCVIPVVDLEAAEFVAQFSGAFCAEIND